MHYKKLEGKNIYLSPMKVEDAEKFAIWMNDNDITDNIHSTTRVISFDGERSWVSKILERGGYTFSILKKENDELIGNCGLMDVNFIDGTATIGIFIGDKENQNKGYGSEVINLLLNYGFNNLRLHNINLAVFDFNKQAIACYKKIGFKEYGRRHETYFLNGKWYDEILMEIIENDYNK